MNKKDTNYIVEEIKKICVAIKKKQDTVKRLPLENKKLKKQLRLHGVGALKVNSCICQEMTKKGANSWYCRGCNTHWE